jgi:hypothetical protein
MEIASCTLENPGLSLNVELTKHSDLIRRPGVRVPSRKLSSRHANCPLATQALKLLNSQASR